MLADVAVVEAVVMQVAEEEELVVVKMSILIMVCWMYGDLILFCLKRK